MPCRLSRVLGTVCIIYAHGLKRYVFIFFHNDLCFNVSQQQYLPSEGNEMGFLKYSHGKCVDCPDDGDDANVAAKYTVANFKQGGMAQDLHIFPHATSWELDHFFSNSYHMALSDIKSEYVFPRTAEQANKINKHGKNDSTGVTKWWVQKFQSICTFKNGTRENGPNFCERDHKFTDGFCSHSGKKYMITEMSRYLNPIYLIFRAGWTVKNAHTLFDYIVKNGHHDVQAAKICAGWTSRWNNEVWGGYTNRLSDLSPGTQDQFELFTKELFCCQQEM